MNLCLCIFTDLLNLMIVFSIVFILFDYVTDSMGFRVMLQLLGLWLLSFLAQVVGQTWCHSMSSRFMPSCDHVSLVILTGPLRHIWLSHCPLVQVCQSLVCLISVITLWSLVLIIFLLLKYLINVPSALIQETMVSH